MDSSFSSLANLHTNKGKILFNKLSTSPWLGSSLLNLFTSLASTVLQRFLISYIFLLSRLKNVTCSVDLLGNLITLCRNCSLRNFFSIPRYVITKKSFSTGIYHCLSNFL